MIIYRERIDNKKFKYVDATGNEIKDPKILDYISKLPPIPPAYKEVEIFYGSTIPKILYSGIDAKGRLQQIYSPQWRKQADKDKFRSLIDFGHKLPKIMLDLNKVLKSPKITKEKLIAIMIRMIYLCGFRIGQLKYQRMYNSTGISTLMKKHIYIKSNGLEIKFIGKKGVLNDCFIEDTDLINELKKIIHNKKDTEHIFTYTTDTGSNLVTAIDVNNWLKSYNPIFTTRFFRIYIANMRLLEKLKNEDYQKLTETKRKKMIGDIIKRISCDINNSPNICKKSYIDQNLIDMFIKHPRKFKQNFNIKDSHLSYIKFLEQKFNMM